MMPPSSGLPSGPRGGGPPKLEPTAMTATYCFPSLPRYVTGTVIGTIILGTMTSGFTFLRVDAYYQESGRAGRDGAARRHHHVRNGSHR